MLSIITINLNNVDGLKRTAHSLVSQSFTDLEWVLVDGNSSDGSQAFILETVNNSNLTPELRGNIKWISESDQGIYDAMNKGILMATGEYCLFLNSGDWFTHDKVLEEFFQHKPEADIVSGDIYFFDTAANHIKWYVPSPQVLTAKTLFNGTLPHQATLIRRKLFDELGFYNQELKIASDWEFFVKALLENNCTYQHIQVTLSYFAMDGISCSKGTNSLPRKEQLQVLNNKYPRFIADFDLLSKLEAENLAWKGSREFKVYQVLKRAGVINIGVWIIRVAGFLRRLSRKL